MNFEAAEIEALLQALPTLTLNEQEQLLSDLDKLDKLNALQEARDNFLKFCARVYPDFKEGPHHRHMAPLLHNVLSGAEIRLTVSMPPRFGKSITCSFLFVAWYLGHNPTHHIIMVTHTADLSASFGRMIRNLLDSPVYAEIFPNTVVSRDKSAADNWTTTVGGKYLAVGVGANIAGHGAHLCLIDDAVSEQVVLSGNPDIAFENAWNYIQVGPLQRLMPNGRVLQIGTRWGRKDPIGRALRWSEENPGSPPWHEVRFPAILPSGRSLWPEQWPVEQLLAKKASMQPQYWAAQYMQEPTSEESAIIKREWWKLWDNPRPPVSKFILQSWDTAHEAKTRSDFSACTTWGVWTDESDNDRDKLVLLNAWKGRLEFPELKRFVLKHYQEWEPDCLLVEKKAAGAPLIQELRAMGVPVEEYTPSRKGAGISNDKIARMNSVSDIFASGSVYAPSHLWAQEVINEVAEGKAAEHDDLTDTVIQALIRFRNGGFIRLESDMQDEPRWHRPRREAYY